MARRHRFVDPAAKLPFHAAFAAINTWEKRVCYTTVTPEFTLTDVVNWLYPAHVLDKLRAAYPLMSSGQAGTSEVLHQSDLILYETTMRIDCDSARICTPRHGLLCPQEDTIDIIPAINGYAAVVRDFNVVRDVVTWLNENATAAAARYYFPALGNFLPPEHEFHEKSGCHFKEPKRSIGEIAPKIRQAAEIVTQALFCPHNEGKMDGKDAVKLTFSAHHLAADGWRTGRTAVSQSLVLI